MVAEGNDSKEVLSWNISSTKAEYSAIYIWQIIPVNF